MLMAILCMTIFSQCANPISPTGGDPDEDPPKLDSLESTPSLQTNFEIQDLYFAFDEWVVVRDPFQQVVISPPLQTFPEVTTKGRGVILKFDSEETLLENTTYTINFGSAIQDLNEGNVLENFKFVFSTGDIIDSLKISGHVIDAKEKTPIEGALVMLYDQLSDSMIYQSRPVYFSKSAKDGSFQIENIREDTFQLLALKDENLNYLYDLPTELIAFIDTSIYIGNDSAAIKYKLSLFQKENPVNIESTITNLDGVIKVLFNQVIDASNAVPLTDLEGMMVRHEFDTLMIWHTDPLVNEHKIEIRALNLIDTITIAAKEENDNPRRPGFKYLRSNTRNNAGRTPFDPISLRFTNPITQFDSSKIRIVLDSVTFNDFTLQIDSVDRRYLNINASWPEESQGTLVILPGCASDMFGQEIIDTTTIKFKNEALKNFGNIKLNAANLDTNQTYIIHLRDQEKVIRRAVIQGQTAWSATYSMLTPKTYNVEVILDLNGNGKWDTGEYSEKRQPEPYLKQDIEPLRAGWDVTAQIITKLE